MAHQVIDIECPGCGAPVSTNDTECMYCHRPVIISSFNSVNSMSLSDINKYAGAYRNALAQNPDSAPLNHSVAMCYLKLKLYDKAQAAFEKAIEENFDNSETYFYAAVALLKGEKPFLRNRDEIQKILDYLNAAVAFEERGIYYYLMAYIKKDYFERKYLISRPNSSELLSMAKQRGCSQFDVQQLSGILNVTIGLQF